jgi:hypothetical protein
LLSNTTVVRRQLIIGWAFCLIGAQTAVAQQPTNTQPPDAETASPIRPNYFVPFLDIVLFDFGVNRFGYYFGQRPDFEVDETTIRRNLRLSSWVFDNDPFSVNQFLHPYQGSMYHGFARSAGLNFWASMGYTFLGSALWETIGETTRPSKNDQVATGIGGSFLGEPLFRLAELVVGRSDHRFGREFAALIISPATGGNRLFYGDRFRGVFPSRDPAVSSRVQFGMTGTASVRKLVTQSLTRNEMAADVAVEYGMPGKPDYEYRRPFDYFNFQFTSSTGSRFENIFSRGLLAGHAYGDATGSTHGVWGLYGSYDYVAPQIFRVSSVALSLGNTAQRRVGDSSAVQSTILAGVGYGTSGGLGTVDDNDYHYGLTPQALAAVRFVAGGRAAFDLTLRDYYVSRYVSTRPGESENVARADALFSVRLASHHAASVRYIWTQRTTYGTARPEGDVTLSRGSVGLFYTFFGDRHLGVAGF